MSTTRREFLDRLAVGTAALGGLPLALGATARALDAAPLPASSAAEWDLSWVNRLTGKKRVVFDIPEIESGYGVWRASIWMAQYENVLGVPARDMSAAVVLRHNAIVLAMTQAFWDRYELGKSNEVLHPITQAATDRNPVLLSSARGEQPAQFDSFALDKLMARGGVALACDLALRDLVQTVAKKDGLSADAARAKTIEHLVPGVVLQPSGVFAAIRAQEAGCMYLRAS